MIADSPAEILRNYLVTQGIIGSPTASSLAFPAFLGLLPDLLGTIPVPDDAICLTNTTGVKDGRIMATGETIWHYGVQIKVRTLDEEDGFLKAAEISTALDAVLRANVVVGSNTYNVQNVSHSGAVTYAGREQSNKQRAIHVLNLLVTIKAGPAVGPTPQPGVPSRYLVAVDPKSLTNYLLVALFRVVLPGGSRAGGTLNYTIEATNGTDYHVSRGEVPWEAFNKAGTMDGDAQPEIPVQTLSDRGTLTAEFDWDFSVPGFATLGVKAHTSLTPTTFRIYYTVANDSAQEVDLV